MDDTGNHTPATVLTYDGEIGPLYRIFLVNLLLTIVTLGIWRFWATTRMRRYIWSRTSCMGQRFEYDGTGGQLFVGFLLALACLIGIFAAAGVAGFLLAQIHQALAIVPFGVAYLVVIVLALGAPFSAQRYRLSHTVWRGIRGGMHGSMFKYGLRSLLYFWAVGLTLFQLLPWASMRLAERRINASSFGNLQFVAQGRAGAVYLRFLITSIALLVLAGVIFGGFFVIQRPMIELMSAQPDAAHAQLIIRSMGVTIFFAYLIFGVGVALITAGYEAVFYRHLTGHTRLGDLRFGSDVSGSAILWLRIGNVVLLVVTLGLGLPIVVQRNVRFFTRHLLVTGTLDITTLMQSDQPVSQFGEGMFQALDAGAGVM